MLTSYDGVPKHYHPVRGIMFLNVDGASKSFGVA